MGDFWLGRWHVRPELDCIVSNDGEEYHLEPKVMDLLVYFSRHAAVVIPKERLIQAVWTDSFVGDGAVNYALSELRKVLGDDARNPTYIETIPRRGYRLIAPVTGREPPKPHGLWLKTGGAIALVVLMAVMLWYSGVFGPSAPTEKSIAVLPFENLNGDPEKEYFGDGLTDAIIGNLSMIGGLKVVSRTSSMRYRNTEKDLPEIGEELGVAAILEGTVSWEQDRVRVRTQLINAATDMHLWSEGFDREVSSIFAIQTEIAEEIASALGLKLAAEKRAQMSKSPTQNLEAYNLYLKGRQYFLRFRAEDNEAAIEMFKRALRLDPDFALALAGLAKAYGQRTTLFGYPVAWLDTALETAEKAADIAPDLAAAHSALAGVFRYKGRFSKAIVSAQKAFELNPNSDDTLFELGWIHQSMGRPDEALPYFKKALDLSPRLPMSYRAIGSVYRKLSEYEKGESWVKTSLEIQPDDLWALGDLVFTYRLQERWTEATVLNQRLLSMAPNSPRSWHSAGRTALDSGDDAKARHYFERAAELATVQHGRSGIPFSTHLGYLHWKAGERETARRFFARSIRYDEAELAAGTETYHPFIDLTYVHSMLGEKEESLNWFEKAIEAGWLYYGWSQRSPLLENIRDEPRFHLILAELRADVAEMRLKVRELEKEWGWE